MADDETEPKIDPNSTQIFLKKKSQLSHGDDGTTNMNAQTESFTTRRVQESLHESKED